MTSIVDETLVSFNTLEKKIFNYVCTLAQEITKIMLESYDTELAEQRDRGVTEIRESAQQQSRLSMERSAIHAEYTRPWEKTVKRSMYICWMKQCIWTKSD